MIDKLRPYDKFLKTTNVSVTPETINDSGIPKEELEMLLKHEMKKKIADLIYPDIDSNLNIWHDEITNEYRYETSLLVIPKDEIKEFLIATLNNFTLDEIVDLRNE